MKQAALILFFLLLPCFNSHADEPPEEAPISPWSEVTIQDSPATPVTQGVARQDRVSVSAAPWQPTIVFEHPLPAAPGNPSRLAESVAAGARIGGAPIMELCSGGGCNFEGLLLWGSMSAIGAALGAVIGIGREIAANFQKEPTQPPGFSSGEIQATSPVIVTAAIESLGGSAFQTCVQGKLTAGREKIEPLQWKGDGRVATLMPAEEAARDSLHYAVETFLSGVVLVPGEVTGQEAGGVPASLVVGAGLRIHDPGSGTSREISTEWRGDSRTLHEWAESDGTLLKEALSKGCDALADQLLTESKIAWLGL